ncbi:AraC family transcriptional regulator [Paenibacillus sp. LHD-117]|uniref:helix-turn-helix transcriptional regulator n=1 Tax=Paenibacillus sp. LHD-117 TaxID=3071412 RepID=UPI0027DEEA19|nr:AraC family transcriptional regulator [Paenibacillus sp. LHD-117]MDQ6423542.1 AraC family transcriptional regulator [Paenibacillus sp. LHD-117]
MDIAAVRSLSPYVRVALDHWLQPGTVIAERMLWDYELLFVKHGTLEVEIEQTRHVASAGDVLLFKPRQSHVIRVSEHSNVHQPHVHFDLIELADSEEVPVSFKHEREMSAEEARWFRDDLLSGPDLRLPNLIRLRSVHPFEEILFRIIREYEMRLPFYRIRLKSLMLELLVCLLRDAHLPLPADVGGADPVPLEDIQLFLSENASRELTLDELADQFHLNKHYLIRRFKSAYGITPIQYHQQMRLERARSLLKHSRLSIQDISDALGYPSIHAFSRAFKNKEGRSPTSYRNAAIGQQ